MSLRIVDRAGQTIGILRVAEDVRVIDLESLRRLGAHRVELLKA